MLRLRRIFQKWRMRKFSDLLTRLLLIHLDKHGHTWAHLCTMGSRGSNELQVARFLNNKTDMCLRFLVLHVNVGVVS